ncbi:hypothetical protein OQA88_5480 [Cercophora sp. LCS_1]
MAPLRTTILVQPPSETTPSQPWSPSPVLRVDFTLPYLDRTCIKAKAVLVGWHGHEIVGGLKGTATADPHFGLPKGRPGIYAPTEWNAYFCWEGLAVVDEGSYKLRFEVEVPGVGREVVQSRSVLVWRHGGILERMGRPSADEFRTLERLTKEVGRGPFRTVKYEASGGPTTWF